DFVEEGIAATEAAATPEEEPATLPPKRRYRVYFDEYLNLPDSVYWDSGDLLPRKPGGTVCLIGGLRGSHKTNVTVSLTMDAVMLKQAKAVYVACEGQYGLGKMRVPAHCREWAIDP